MFTFELVNDCAKWLIHKFIYQFWLTIRLNKLKAGHKTNCTKIWFRFFAKKRKKIKLRIEHQSSGAIVKNEDHMAMVPPSNAIWILDNMFIR